MKNKNWIIVFGFALLAMFSCTKKETVKSATVGSATWKGCKVLNYYINDRKNACTYNNVGQLISVSNQDGMIYYFYQSGKLSSQMIYGTANDFSKKIIYKYDADGSLESRVDSGSMGYMQATSYAWYDGAIVADTDYFYSSKVRELSDFHEYRNKDSNITEVNYYSYSASSGTFQLYGTTQYTYDSTCNPMRNVPVIFGFSPILANKNNILTMKSNGASSASNSIYTYEYNSKKQPVKCSVDLYTPDYTHFSYQWDYLCK